jgi:hypothetical protein
MMNLKNFMDVPHAQMCIDLEVPRWQFMSFEPIQ